MRADDRSGDLPPGAWAPLGRAARRLVAPLHRFLAIEASSGIVLLAATALALVWANSPLAGSYDALWHMALGVQLGDLEVSRPLHFWVNDGLMTIFFLVVGLEIRRETHEGDLADLRRAALPLAAALGGMVIPAAIYAAINAGGAGAGGWGIPMATDIAFAVGVLTLLGRRAPPALRVLLLALAIIDDIGAILVIAIFYSDGIAVQGLVLSAGGVVGVIALRGLGIRAPLAYVVPGAAVWLGLYAAGVHPTLAGVVLGLLAPIERDRREALSPCERLQRRLHPWVAFAIMPLFALANAGVAVGGADLSGDGGRVFVGIVLGLALGKPIGIAALSAAAAALGVARRPAGVGHAGIALVGVVGGIGFTMSLFVAQLAFPPGPLLDTAKLAILVGSGAAMVLGGALGFAGLGRGRAD